MTVRPFKLTFEDGSEFFCLAYSSPAERDQAISGAPAPTVPQIESGRPRGRPSYDSMLSEAAQALQLDPARPLAERARAVLRHLAQSRDASEIPSRRTVETFLAGAPVRRKSRNKSRGKSGRAKLAATGG